MKYKMSQLFMGANDLHHGSATVQVGSVRPTMLLPSQESRPQWPFMSAANMWYLPPTGPTTEPPQELEVLRCQAAIPVASPGSRLSCRQFGPVHAASQRQRPASHAPRKAQSAVLLQPEPALDRATNMQESTVKMAACCGVARSRPHMAGCRWIGQGTGRLAAPRARV